MRRLLASPDVAVHSSWFTYVVHTIHAVERDWPAKLTDAVVWYDYFAIPQDREANLAGFEAAVASIPAYVERASFMLVLCPAAAHKDSVDAHGEPVLCDYFSWKRRGWCRVERVTMYITNFYKRCPIMLVQDDLIEMEGITDELFLHVGLGDFACCAMGHRVRGKAVECDKQYAGTILRSLITQAGTPETDDERWFRALRPFFLVGLPTGWLQAEEDGTSVAAFLAAYGFASVHDGAESGWTPLRFAVVAGYVDAVKGMLAMKADVEAPLKESAPNRAHCEGTSILGTAMTFGQAQTGRRILSALLENGANPDHHTTDERRMRPPGVAAYHMNAEGDS